MASGSLARSRGKIVRHISDRFIVGSAQCRDQESSCSTTVLTRLRSEIEVTAAGADRGEPGADQEAAPDHSHVAFDDRTSRGPVIEQVRTQSRRCGCGETPRKRPGALLAISRRHALSETVTMGCGGGA